MKKARITIGVGNHGRPATQEDFDRLDRMTEQDFSLGSPHPEKLLAPRDCSFGEEIFRRIRERLGWLL